MICFETFGRIRISCFSDSIYIFINCNFPTYRLKNVNELMWVFIQELNFYNVPKLFSFSYTDRINSLTSLSIGFTGFRFRSAQPSIKNGFKWRGREIGVLVVIMDWEMIGDVSMFFIFSKSITLILSLVRRELSVVVCWSIRTWSCNSSSDSNVQIQDSCGQNKNDLIVRSVRVFELTFTRAFWSSSSLSNDSVSLTFNGARKSSYSIDLPKPILV